MTWEGRGKNMIKLYCKKKIVMTKRKRERRSTAMIK